MECSEVLIKAKEAIEDSKRAVNALVKHLKALDEEIEAYVKAVENSEHAASYLGSQVESISEHIADLTNVPETQMQAMMKILADTEKKMKEHEKEAKANKEELKEARTKRQKAGGERVRTSPS
jgi:molecular chaperone DnaK (HSP70)